MFWSLEIPFKTGFTVFFSQYRTIYDIMWKDIVERSRPQTTIWRMRIACWISMATNTHAHTHTHTHTLRLCNTLRFSTATFVDRLNIKITLTPNFTAIVTAHGKTRSYLHRFKEIESPECPCGSGTQTVEHLLYDCGKLNNERGKLIANITKEDHWPVRKSVLVSKYLKQVIHVSNSNDYEIT